MSQRGGPEEAVVVSEQDVAGLVSQALLPLAAVSQGLHQRAAAYVLQGCGPEVLVEVTACAQDANVLLAPGIAGHCSRRARADDPHLGRLEAVGVPRPDIENSVGGFPYAEVPVWSLRDRLYRCDGLAAPQWVRLGRLLERIRQADTCTEAARMPEEVPAWFEALVIDVLRTALLEAVSDRVRRRDRRAEILAEARPGWGLDRLSQILAAGEVPQEERASVLLLTCYYGTSDYGWSPWPSTLPGAAGWLAGHAAQLPSTLSARLTVQGRRDLVHDLTRVLTQDASLAQACAHLVAALGTDASKQVRREAVPVLELLEPGSRERALLLVLAEVPAARAVEVVELLASLASGGGVLDAAARANPRIRQLVAQTQARRAALRTGPGDGGEGSQPLELPPFTPLETGPGAAPVKEELRGGLERMAESLAASAQSNPSLSGRAWFSRQIRQVRETTEADLDAVVAAAEGRATEAPAVLGYLGLSRLVSLAPSLTLAHRLRLRDCLGTGLAYRPLESVYEKVLEEGTDLRAVEDLAARLGVSTQDDLERLAWDHTEPQASWPWWATHVDRLAERLRETSQVPQVLRILACFPQIPAELLPTVTDIALGSSKVNRPLAQELLGGHPAARELAEQGLSASSAQVRASAASWVASLAQAASVPVLRARLARERNDVVRARLLRALEACGDSTEDLLSPEVLEAEAAKGLRRRLPASLGWFSWDGLPQVRWADGRPVDPQVVRWWVVLADKVKDPDGRGVVSLYLSLLDPGDRQELASHVVRAWVSEDTRRHTPEESRAHAQAEGARQWQYWQDRLAEVRSGSSGSYPWEEEQAAVPLEERVAAAYAAHQALYAGSAAADKGLLAFGVAMDGSELAALVRSYLRDHPGRPSQSQSLARALAANGSPQALQVLLSVARRHTMAGLQATATELSREVAAERGWSAEELADRTVPTAGFGQDGLLRLSYGGREVTGRLTEDLRVVLTDEEGRTRKSLPAPRAGSGSRGGSGAGGGEDPEAAAQGAAEEAKAARRRLSAARKEVKAVLALQPGRLYEAMCGGRCWGVGVWREVFLGHPLMSRLASRLVWVAGPAEVVGGSGSGGGLVGSATGPAGVVVFRPDADGTLLGADDSVVEPGEDAVVRLAHASLLGEREVEAWRAHLADYEVTPLLDQLGAVLPRVTEGQTEMSDLAGHMTDSLSLRGVVTRRGYRRGEVLDAGWFFDYVKELSSLGLTVVVSFSGSAVPEESIPCATGSLVVRRGRRVVPLEEVPPVLLAEARADYEALAALGPYDPDWERKVAL